jgi:hypothetical protein
MNTQDKRQYKAHRAPDAQPSAVQVHIEELVLEGFDARDRYRIAEGLEQELAQVFAERGVPPGISKSVRIERFDAGEFQVTPGTAPKAVGAQVAQTLFRYWSGGHKEKTSGRAKAGAGVSAPAIPIRRAESRNRG